MVFWHESINYNLRYEEPNWVPRSIRWFSVKSLWKLSETPGYFVLSETLKKPNLRIYILRKVNSSDSDVIVSDHRLSLTK